MKPMLIYMAIESRRVSAAHLLQAWDKHLASVDMKPRLVRAKTPTDGIMKVFGDKKGLHTHKVVVTWNALI